jgi:molybdopterin-guanine dinucleotide biosynthesis protein A
MTEGLLDTSAFILAGGTSSRMGTDKAFLELYGQTLLLRALGIARLVAADVRIVGPRDKYAPYAPVVEDMIPGRGPLGGIHAALSATSTDLNLILAVDLPFLRPELLLYLFDRARGSGATVTVPRAGGHLHPLCAVYRRTFRDRAEDALGAGRNKIDPLFQPADTLLVEEADLVKLSFPATMFDNLNTREEYDRAQDRGNQSDR